MKKNGFTLVEVITVIVILGIIILIAVPSYIGLSENLRQREYDNKLKQIEIKATEWATDNNITDDQTITISKLVDDGYVNMDDETSNDKRVINPLNKESMECYHVEISVDNGKYKAKVKESTDCELKDVEEQDKNIKVVGYEIDSSTNTILNSKELELQGNELPWSGKDILLLTTSDVYENPSSITYSSGSTSETKSGLMYSGSFQEGDTIDITQYQNLYIVSANVILKSKYNIIYEMESEKPKKQILVKIDKENPNGSYRMLEKWGNSEKKKVLLSGSDGVGSGVKGFYVNTENTIDKAEFIEANEKSEATVSKDMGTYYYWIEDNVGNRNTEANILNITNIDNTPPECVYPEERNEWSTEPFTITWGCKDTESGCATDTKEWTKTFESGTIGSYTLEAFEIEDVAGNITTCPAKQISVMIDTDPPTCDITIEGELGKNNWYIKNPTLTLETKDVNENNNGVGVDEEKIGLSTKTTVDYNKKYTATQGDTKELTYYGYVSDKLGNATVCTKKVKVDTTPPTLSLGIADIHNAAVNCNDNISGVVGNSYYTVGLANGANRTVSVTCENQAGFSVDGSHTYTYSGCAAGENTCQYGCDSCWDPCQSTYQQCHYGCDTGSCWDSNANCYNHPYGCTQTYWGTCHSNSCICTSWANPCQGGSAWPCGISCCTSYTFDYSCQKTRPATCYTWACDGGYVSCQVNCSGCKYTTTECQGGSYECNCSSCHTGHNTCQAGFWY